MTRKTDTAATAAISLETVERLKALCSKVGDLEHGITVVSVADALKLIADVCREFDSEVSCTRMWSIAFTLDAYSEALIQHAALEGAVCDLRRDITFFLNGIQKPEDVL